jgi:hypothetical protein
MKQGQFGRIFTDEKERKAFIPTTKKHANARVIEHSDNGLMIHWLSNYNLDGDFRTELMMFDNEIDLISDVYLLDQEHEATRKKERTASGLIN